MFGIRVPIEQPDGIFLKKMENLVQEPRGDLMEPKALGYEFRIGK